LLYRAKLLAIFYSLHVEISHQLTNNQVKWVYSAMVSPGSEKKNNAPQTRSWSPDPQTTSCGSGEHCYFSQWGLQPT